MLMRPIGGRCNPRADFEETVPAHLPAIPPAHLAAAVAAGDRPLADASPNPGATTTTG
ncbi:hypothetical protein [Kitasatospora sp. NPDC057198]|uniref:hypothetical protein n=1 Tax=Kitasatospora sp. NPDC057198 TaxID=3346046 RepID=UPI00362DB6C3